MNLFRGLTPPVLLAAYSLIICVWSFIGAANFWVWLFEIFVGVIAVIVLLLTYRRFPFSNLAYVLVGVHFTVLAVGAHYTYAGTPLFDWVGDVFGLSRNHFDRVGHFMQGFVPLIIAREILLRTTRLQRGKMLSFLGVSVCLGMSAFWELLEMWVVMVFYPGSGPEWLGLQGDVWDAQNDMQIALFGAMAALFLLSRVHDRSMAALRRSR